jgi:hypothetical protein
VSFGAVNRSSDSGDEMLTPGGGRRSAEVSMSVNSAGDYPRAAKCYQYVPRGYNFVKVYVLVILTFMIAIASLVGLFVDYGNEGMKYMWSSLLSGCLMFWVQPPSIME